MTAVSTTTSAGITTAAPKGVRAPVPAKTKRMRYLIVGTVFFSAYSVFLSIKMFRYSILPFIPTSIIAAWTLAMLFPLEVAHHGLEFNGEDREGPSSWSVDKATITRSYITSAVWAVCCVRSMVVSFCQMGPKDLGVESWVLASLEFGTATTLYLLAKQWSDVDDLEAEATKTSTDSSASLSVAEKATVSTKQ
ncbi:hypothetical protein H1R20_g13509, partial [Candolleomyces eurysporus]